MGLGDLLRGFFAKKRNPELRHLEDFLATHRGVEGYVEPRTATQPTTLLLVDRDGETVRGAVREAADAFAFCEQRGIPVYDAAVIGYPKRMRDFERRRRAPEGPAIDDEIADLERRLAETDPNTPNN